MRILKSIFRLGLWLVGAALIAVAVGAVLIGVYLVPELPSTDILKDIRFQVPLRVYSKDRQLLAEFGEKRRIPLRLEEIPEQMRLAVLASEDEHFYRHPGVDWRGLARAVWHIMRTGRKGPGGSTITMQVARNFFLGREKTYLRKLNEILLSFKIERELSKDEILELYVNKIFLGNRAYGVGAAAEVYYGRDVSKLTLAQMAMIAGLPQRPSAFNPIVNPRQAIARRNYVLRRMLAAGFIDEAAGTAAQSSPVTASLHSPIVALNAPYVAEMVRAFMEEWAGDKAYTDGYSVYTTIDSRLQRAATSAIRNGLIAYDRRHGFRGPEVSLTLPVGGSATEWERLLKDLPPVGGLRAALVLEVTEQDAKVYVRGHGEAILPWESLKWARKYVNENRRGPKLESTEGLIRPGDVIRVVLGEEEWQLSQVPAVEGALVALHPDDGQIAALVGGFDFFRSKFNRATQAERQPGSNFKPFIYSAALEKGLTAATLINDAPVVFDDPGLEAAWRPENYSGKFFGPTRLRLALKKSRNLVSIRLLRRIGLDHALEHIRRFGFDADRLPRDLSLSLGSGGLTPLEVARGYAVLANGGYAVIPYFVSEIRNSRGEPAFVHSPSVVCRTCTPPGTSAKEPAPDLDSTPASADNSATSTRPAVERSTRPSSQTSAYKNALESNSSDSASSVTNIAPRVVPEQNVWIINSILRDVIRSGTGRRALTLKRKDLAGKTGTTNDQHDAWFSGFAEKLAATTWIGFDKLAPLGRGETGSRAALPMWIDFMRVALSEVEEHIPERPDGLLTVRIDPETGALASAGDPKAIFETFRSQFAPTSKSASNKVVITGPAVRERSAEKTAKEAEGSTKRLF